MASNFDTVKRDFFNSFHALISELPEKVSFVLSIERKTGTYEGRDYDNTKLFTVSWRYAEDGNPLTYFESIKVRTSLFNTMPVAVGDCVVVSYNRFGAVQELHKI